MVTKDFKQALQNIQWAIDNEYPADKIQKLIERRKKCLKMLESIKKNANETIDNFYKLSYPPNPKIPFIIDGLELRTTGKFGRGIFATRDLKLGDFISIEEPVLYKLTEFGAYSHCCNCVRSNKMNLIPCSKFETLMFCSEKCRDEMYLVYQYNDFWMKALTLDNPCCRTLGFFQTFAHAFGSADEVQEFARQNDYKNWNKTIFDYDLSDPNDPNYKQKLLKSILSFYSPDSYDEIREKLVQDAISTGRLHMTSIDGNEMPVLHDFLDHIETVFESSAIHNHNRLFLHEEKDKILESLTYERDHLIEDIQLLPFTPLINYSCYPNIEKLVYNGRVAHYVVRPIKAGEELFRNPA
jgi:hypothetical protein